MAMPSQQITKSEFREQYNVVNVLTDKKEIMKQLQTFDSNNQAVAFGIKKKPRDTTPIWFKQYEQRMNQKFNQIGSRLTQIENRITQIVQANNLIDPALTGTKNI